jgi:hypothetical protein
VNERDHLGEPGIDGRIILRWIFRKWDVWGTNWIELAQDRDTHNCENYIMRSLMICTLHPISFG